MPCYITSYFACYVMLCYVMLCYVMLCYVMLCYVMLRYVMLCCAVQFMICNMMTSKKELSKSDRPGVRRSLRGKEGLETAPQFR